MKNSIMFTSVIFLVGSLLWLGGCAGLGGNTAAEMSPIDPVALKLISPHDHEGLAAFYTSEALRLEEQAKELINSAEAYRTKLGANSELAQQYTEFSHSVRADAEQAVTLSRLHRQMAKEVEQAREREMFPQP